MRTSTVHVQREANVVRPATLDENTNNQTQTTTSSSKMRRFHCYLLLGIAVIVVLAVSITVPLVVTKNQDKTTTTENKTLSEPEREVKTSTNTPSSTLQSITARSTTFTPSLTTIGTFTPSLTTKGEDITNSNFKVGFLNFAGDKVFGIHNTTAGQSTGGYDGVFLYQSEMPIRAMDDNLNTKYVNFGSGGCPNCISYQPGRGTGFFVTPSISKSTVTIGLRFATGNDYPNRDPITVTLEGSNATTLEELHQGSSWTLMYNGSTGISPTEISDRNKGMLVQWFNNTIRFASYRILVTSQRGNDSSVQYSEARIVGYI